MFKSHSGAVADFIKLGHRQSAMCCFPVFVPETVLKGLLAGVKSVFPAQIFVIFLQIL